MGAPDPTPKPTKTPDVSDTTTPDASTSPTAENPESTPSRTPLNDIDNHWAKNYINSLYNNHIINGYPGGDFKPDNHVTRAEVCTMIHRTQG